MAVTRQGELSGYQVAQKHLTLLQKYRASSALGSPHGVQNTSSQDEDTFVTVIIVLYIQYKIFGRCHERGAATSATTRLYIVLRPQAISGPLLLLSPPYY